MGNQSLIYQEMAMLLVNSTVLEIDRVGHLFIFKISPEVFYLIFYLFFFLLSTLLLGHCDFSIAGK